jgi:hypothetical protein
MHHMKTLVLAYIVFSSTSFASSLDSNALKDSLIYQSYYDRHLRVERKHSVLIETPWNGLVGVGILYMFRPVWQIAVEGGAGYSTMGLKYGLRTRYCFLNRNASPFAGLGFMHAAGEKNKRRIEQGVNATFDLDPINFIQITGGLDLVIDFGLTFVIGAGWAFALNDGVKNVAFGGVPMATYFDQKRIDAFQSDRKLLYQGGLVISLGVGGSFF